MDSIPPATTISDSPSCTACAARATAFSPEPQTLLMVIAATFRSAAAIEGGLARGVLAEAGLHDVAHDGFVDLLAVKAGAASGLGDGFGAEFGGGEAGQGALEFAYRGADGAENY